MKIRVWLVKNNHTVSSLAKALGYSRGYLDGVINGGRKLTSRVASKIWGLTNGKVGIRSIVDGDPLSISELSSKSKNSQTR